MHTRTRIKFCGLTRLEDVQLAVRLGIDEIGLVFAGGPRCITAAQARPLIDYVYSQTADRPLITLLFMDQATGVIAPLIEQLRPDQLQFHGQESTAFCDQFTIPWTKAIAAGDNDNLGSTIERWHQNAGRYGPLAVILDAHVKGSPGGQGHTFDWQRIPKCRALPIYIAGGLHPDNVGAAVSHYRPYAVDVSSGIEDAPGIKNHAKMRAFVAEVKHAE